MTPFELDHQCIPDQGIITLGNIEQHYSLRKGTSGMLGIRFGFKYVENGYGHAVELDTNADVAAELGLALLAEAIKLKQPVAYAEYPKGYMDEFPSSMRGHYILVDMAPRVHDTRKAILFVSETYDKGRIYQHYASNVLKTDEAVIAELDKLIKAGRLVDA